MILDLDDVIAAIATPGGPAERCVIRLSGAGVIEVLGPRFACSAFSPFSRSSDAHIRTSFLKSHARDPGTDVSVRTLAKWAPSRQSRRHVGQYQIAGWRVPVPVELWLWPTTRSYTGQPSAELHLVGSPPIVDALLEQLYRDGARPARAGEFTLRAFLAGRVDLVQAEAVLGVIDATDHDQLQTALTQLAGGLSRQISEVRESLLLDLADLEAGLDFVDEDIEFVTNADTILRIGSGIAHLMNLKRQLDDRSVSRRPMRVVLVGEPNAGKSSLFNALIGADAALVSAKAGTTRDYLSHALDLGGQSIELIDTAGWQSAGDSIEEQAQSLGRGQTELADLVLVCAPVDEPEPETLPLRGVLLRTKADLGTVSGLSVSVKSTGGLAALSSFLKERAAAFARPALAPSQSRCRAHIDAAIADLRTAHNHAVFNDPPELLALALRQSLDQIGAMAGSIYTNDLLDRIFSRFCIGK